MHKRVLEAGKASRAIPNFNKDQEGYYDPNFGWTGPNKPDKGKRLGSCNVTACQRHGAYWYNKVMDAWYCTECAHQINYLPLDDGTYLCSLKEDAREEYFHSKKS